MAEESVRAYCPVCKHRQTFKRDRVSYGWHLTLCVLTLGLWLVSLVAICCGNFVWPWSCSQCGWRLSRASLHRQMKVRTQAIEASPRD